MMLRNSERQAFKQCRHRWQWTYLDGRQSIEAPRALRFGDLIHQALAAYYKPGTRRGPAPAATYERLYHEQAKALEDKGFNVFSDDKWVDALPLGIGMLEGYVKRYSEEDKEYEIVSTEQTFQLLVRVPRKFGVGPDGKLLRFKVVGTFDGVWRHRKTGRIIFREFKTATAIKLDGLALDEQAGLYWTFGPKWLRSQGILKDGELISEISYRFLRKAIPNPDKRHDDMGRVLNKDGSVSKQQPAPYFSPSVPVYRDQADRERVYERVCQEAVLIARARAGLEPLVKNPGPLHMPNCLGCAVREACELHESGADWGEMLKQTMTDWNPYAAHELPERF
jgi:hypothetical protein